MRAGRPPIHALRFAAALALAATRAHAADQADAELAKQLANPVASLITVPFQQNLDCCFGPLNGARYTLNIQPVIPFALSGDWNLITRTIVPVIHQNRTSPAGGDATGLGDITQSFFFSPKTGHGLILAAGPVILWPTGTSDLGSGKWGAGPTALIAQQTEGGYIFGVLANHVWSVADAGGSNRPDVSSTFIQPFVSWTSRTATTVNIDAESTYNWRDGQWSIPLNLTVSHLYRLGSQRVSLGGAVRIYVARDAVAPADPAWGLRFTATLLFPE